MLLKPKLNTTYAISMTPPNFVYFYQGETFFMCLTGEIYVALIPLLLEGLKTTQEIIKKLENDFPLEIIYYALQKLEDFKFIYESVDHFPIQLSSLCEQFKVAPLDALQKLQSTSMQIVSLSKKIEKEQFEAVLNDFGIASIVLKQPANLTVVIVDDYLDSQLQDYCAAAKAAKMPILLLKPLGVESWIGPVFTEDSGCYECLFSRLKLNRSQIILVENHNQTQLLRTKHELEVDSLIHHNLTQAVIEILKFVLNPFENNLKSYIKTFNICTFESSHHVFIKSACCTICGQNSNPVEMRPINLKSQKKKFTMDGGHRIQHPKETYNRLKKHISPITGIISSLEKANHLGNNIHLYRAVFPMYLSNQFPLSQLAELNNSSVGKGKGDMQSKVSCICEAIERFCMSTSALQIKKMASFSELKDVAIHPNLLQNFSDKQFQDREKINVLNLRYNQVPEPFDEKDPISWSPVWSLTEKKTKWIPTNYASLNIVYDQFAFKYIQTNSNGCAAGNTLEEAILQGFYELVERDQSALWWYCKLELPELDLDTFSDPYIQSMREYYDSQGREFWVLDLTLDLKIPTFAAISNSGSIPLIFGLGTHLDPNIALTRAISEMNQMLLIPKMDQAPSSDEKYLYPCKKLNKKSLADFKCQSSDDIKTDILRCQQIIEEKGLEMLICDLSHPDIDLKVARVIIPGLRHFWVRFGPGRLYDIPYQLNLIPKILSEKDLNPVPITF